MAQVTVKKGEFGTIGPLAVETLFRVETGSVNLSTDGGVSNTLHDETMPISFASGLTVRYSNDRSRTAIFDYMPFG